MTRPPALGVPPSQVVMTPPAPDDDRNQRQHVIGLELGLDHEIDVARRQHAIGVAVAAVAREPHRVLDPAERRRGRRSFISRGLVVNSTASRQAGAVRAPARRARRRGRDSAPRRRRR